MPRCINLHYGIDEIAPVSGALQNGEAAQRLAKRFIKEAIGGTNLAIQVRPVALGFAWACGRRLAFLSEVSQADLPPDMVPQDLELHVSAHLRVI